MNDKGKERWHVVATLAAVASVVVAIFALARASQANNLADKANQLAAQANEFVKEANSPVLGAISRVNTNNGQSTDLVVVQNGGGPLRELRCRASALIEISTVQGGSVYIQMPGYFPFPDYTGNSQGTLCSTASYAGSVENFWRIYSAFIEAQPEHGGPYFISKLIILDLDYVDLFGVQWHKFLQVTNQGSFEVLQDKGYAMENSAFENEAKYEGSLGATSRGISSWDGANLWDQFKAGEFQEIPN